MVLAKTFTDINTEEQARERAIEWQAWQSEQDLSWGEVAEWADYFRKLGELYGLTEEFTDNGII